MNNKEAIEKLTNLLNAYEYAQKTNTQVMVELNGMEAEALNLAIKALNRDCALKEKCAYCPHCENCDVPDTMEVDNER